MDEKKKKPAKKVRIGRVACSLWENSSNEGRRYYTASFQKIYRSGDNWRRTGSFSSSDLLALSRVALLAHDEIAALTPAEPSA